MSRKRLPSLPETGRRYVEHTMRARLASPGVERFQRRGGQARRVVITALLLLGALLGAMVALS
jgi:hypothetical protein